MEGKMRPSWYESDKNLHTKESLYPFCERRDREMVDRTKMRAVIAGILRRMGRPKAGRGIDSGGR